MIAISIFAADKQYAN